MDKVFETMLVYHINKLTRLYNNKTKDLNAKVNMLTEEDGKELETLFKKYNYTINKIDKKLFHHKIEKVATINLKDNVNSLFDFFEFDEEDIKNLTKEKIENFRKEDVLLKLNESNPEAFKELYEDKIMQMLLNNDSMLKFINTLIQYNGYVKETIIMFSRESSSYITNLISELDCKYSFSQLLNELEENKDDKIKKIIKDIRELRARRNILEHNDGVINDKYLTMTGATTKKDMGKAIMTSPAYISQAYNNVISFYCLATKLVMKKLGLELDADKVISLLKETKNITNELQMIKYFKF